MKLNWVPSSSKRSSCTRVERRARWIRCSSRQSLIGWISAQNKVSCFDLNLINLLCHTWKFWKLIKQNHHLFNVHFIQLVTMDWMAASQQHRSPLWCTSAWTVWHPPTWRLTVSQSRRCPFEDSYDLPHQDSCTFQEPRQWHSDQGRSRSLVPQSGMICLPDWRILLWAKTLSENCLKHFYFDRWPLHLRIYGIY